MKFSKNKFRLVVGGILASVAICGFAAPPPHSVPKTTIKHIESHSSYAIVSLSKDIVNDTGCTGNGQFPEKIRRFYINIDDQRNEYVLILTAAAARKKTLFRTNGCDGTTNLPVIEGVDTAF